MYNLSGNMKLREYNDLKCKLGKYQQVVIKTAAAGQRDRYVDSSPINQ